jgi:hypothetical protein
LGLKSRNGTRKPAQLPLLDEQREFDNACQTTLGARWQAFRTTKQADYDLIYEELVAERGSDEITIVMQIAPDYLAITRRVTEGRKNAD